MDTVFMDDKKYGQSCDNIQRSVHSWAVACRGPNVKLSRSYYAGSEVIASGNEVMHTGRTNP